MMAILSNHFVVVLDSIIEEDRERVKSKIEACEYKREILTLSFEEMVKYCANIISVRSTNNETVVLMSTTAESNFSPSIIEAITKSYKVVSVNIETIETVGGGSARCMVAELY